MVTCSLLTMIDLLIFYNQQSKLCQVLGISEDSSNEQREHHWAQTSPDNSSEVEHLLKVLAVL